MKVYPFAWVIALSISGCLPSPKATPAPARWVAPVPAWQRAGDAKVQQTFESMSNDLVEWHFRVETCRYARGVVNSDTAFVRQLDPVGKELHVYESSIKLERFRDKPSRLTVTWNELKSKETSSRDIDLPASGSLYDMLELGYDDSRPHHPLPITLLKPKKGSKLRLTFGLDVAKSR